MFTLLPMDEIEALVEEHAGDPRRRVAQRALAREVTDLVHGAGARQAAEEASEILFGADPRQASPAALAAVAREVPVAALDRRRGPRRRRAARPRAPAGRPGVLAGRRPAAARAGRGVGERRQGGPPERAARGRRCSSTTAGCCCARGRRAGRSSISRPRKLTLLRDRR